MNTIVILKDKASGTYTIIYGGSVAYECLGKDEVAEIVNELMGVEESNER